MVLIPSDESIVLKDYKLKAYTGNRISIGHWVFHCFNKYGYDIGLQVRDKKNGKLRSSQKIYYEKGDKYNQKLIEFDPDDKIKLYFNDGSKEQITLDEFYRRANDGDTILPYEIISDQDFEHNEINLANLENPLIKLLVKLDSVGLRYTVYGTENGRALKIKFSFSGLMDLQKKQMTDVRNRIADYIHHLVGGEVFKSGRQCNPCFAAIEGHEPLHAKTGNPIKILHFTGNDNNVNFILKLITDFENSQEAEDYAHLKRSAERIFTYTDKLDLANKFWSIQPFFL